MYLQSLMITKNMDVEKREWHNTELSQNNNVFHVEAFNDYCFYKEHHKHESISETHIRISVYAKIEHSHCDNMLLWLRNCITRAYMLIT